MPPLTITASVHINIMLHLYLFIANNFTLNNSLERIINSLLYAITHISIRYNFLGL